MPMLTVLKLADAGLLASLTIPTSRPASSE
jgi:hypothetical protein